MKVVALPFGISLSPIHRTGEGKRIDKHSAITKMFKGGSTLIILSDPLVIGMRVPVLFLGGNGLLVLEHDFFVRLFRFIAFIATLFVLSQHYWGTSKD